jgi:hypothetical protein
MQRRTIVVTIRALPLLAVVACGDSRVRKLSEGISRDSVLKILAIDTAPGDSLPHVYRTQRYLIDGKMYEVLLYTATDKKAQVIPTVTRGPGAAPDPADADTILDADLTPIVLHDGRVTGWGWQHYDSLARLHGFPIKPR